MQSQTVTTVTVEMLWQQYSKPLVRFATRIINDKESAHELVSDFFVEIHSKKILQLDSISKSYLYQGVKNRCLNYKRSSFNFDRFIDKVKYLTGFASKDGRTAEDELIQNEEDMLLNKAILKLPEHLREVIYLRMKLELPLQEIADCLDIPLGTVKSRLNIALGLLKTGIHREAL